MTLGGLVRVAVAAVALGAWGCEAVYPEGRFACETGADCPAGWVCEARGGDAGGRCFSAPSDAAIAADACADGAACRVRCAAHSDCDNGLYCDGDERCLPADPAADATGCVAAARGRDCDDGIACTTDSCSEADQDCRNVPPDADGDGHADALCLDALGDPLGDDCDDADAARFVGNFEVCDDAGHDEDCDPSTIGFKDDDGDGVIDAQCCNPSADGSLPVISPNSPSHL